MVKFYFATGKADLASGANAALADVAKAVAAGKRAVVSGYHDASGDPAKNAELAKQRAVAVRDALKAAGIPDDKVELKKPEAITGTGDPRRGRVAWRGERCSQAWLRSARTARSATTGPFFHVQG